jgi:hypothetical protein
MARDDVIILRKAQITLLNLRENVFCIEPKNYKIFSKYVKRNINVSVKIVKNKMSQFWEMQYLI